jgi:hypothetical protein
MLYYNIFFKLCKCVLLLEMLISIRIDGCLITRKEHVCSKSGNSIFICVHL